MKVRPYFKRKTRYIPLLPTEARVITIDEKAITELLLENLSENVSKYFNVPMVSNKSTNVMYWDQKNKLLTYAVMPMKYCFDYSLNFDHIHKTVGVTTESLFSPNLSKYKSIDLSNKTMITARDKIGGVTPEDRDRFVY